MQFAYSLPWWLAVLLVTAIAGLTYATYRVPLVPLMRVQAGVLIAVRAFVLTALVLFLFRPIVFLPPASGRDALVPVLVDVSRSMRLNDADGETRIARATAVLDKELLPALSRQFTPDLFSVGERLDPATIGRLIAGARETDLSGALTAVRERYRGQHVAGIVVLSDGGDTGRSNNTSASAAGPPVFAIGIGSPDGIRDREVTSVTAGDQRLDQASVDLRVSASSSGFGRAPFELRVLANGRVLDSHRVVPSDGRSPIDEAFTVSPDPTNPTVYTVEIPVAESEPVAENNSRSVLVNPAGRKRRLLIIEGAPGFEHSFMTRAWSHDPSLEVDSVVRKGKNGEGRDTFFVAAAQGRAPALANGFPSRREDLYAYDGLVIANVEGDFFTRAQLTMAADFVAERGGGLLVVGGRSFSPRGLSGTPLEDALPVELSDRRGGLARTPVGGGEAVPPNKLVVTPEGQNHPTMRIGETPEESRRLWSVLPSLAASAPLGGPRPGATVLAVAAASTGAVFPVVAVQRYGRGRSMIFSGEASWRWKMMRVSTDRSYEFFWRQAARWIAGPSPDPVTIAAPEASEAGDEVSFDIDVADAAFSPVADAVVDATLTVPGGETRPLRPRRAERTRGRYTATLRIDQPGLYRIDTAARRGDAALGTARRWLLVGGADREFADPRLNEAFLRRVARASGGRYVRAADASRIVPWLEAATPQPGAPERRDLWHEPWSFALIVALLSGEWILRRRWGLR